MQVQRRANLNLFAFLRADLNIALTLAAVALRTGDGERRSRSRLNARRAYDTVLRLTSKLRLSADDATALGEKIRDLKAVLLDLGETFP